MHTTLELLKTVKACVPGYSRMISFFGGAKDIKDQIIPLHAVALIGGATDASWALANGVVIDKEQYDAFYRRHLPAVFKSLFESNVAYRLRHSTRDSTLDKNPVLKELVDKCYKIHTFEEIEAHLKLLRSHHFSHNLYTGVLADTCWLSPYHFIEHCFEMVQKTYTLTSKVAFPEDIEAAKKKKKAPARPRSRSRMDEDDEEEADDQDEDEIDTSGTLYWIRTTSKFNTKGQNIAAMLSDDPYSFMTSLKFKVPKGITIDTKGEVPVLKVNVDNSKNMFLVLRTLTAKSQSPDQDVDTETEEDE